MAFSDHLNTGQHRSDMNSSKFAVQTGVLSPTTERIEEVFLPLLGDTIVIVFPLIAIGNSGRICAIATKHLPDRRDEGLNP